MGDNPRPPRPTPALAKAQLAPASESSDPAVHQLLAERQTAISNDDADAVRTINARLAELGYE